MLLMQGTTLSYILQSLISGGATKYFYISV